MINSQKSKERKDMFIENTTTTIQIKYIQTITLQVQLKQAEKLKKSEDLLRLMPLTEKNMFISNKKND